MSTIKFGEIRLNDITKQHIQDCIDTNYVTMGPKTKLFEEKFAKQMDVKYAVGCSSGTTALTCALISLYDNGAKPGDFVICPALSFIATANAIRSAGFVPLPLDVCSDMNIDVKQLEVIILFAELSRTIKNIAGIVVVSMMGKPPNMETIGELLPDTPIILDNCEGYGSRIGGVLTHKYADISVTSHYTAHITASAEFGMVLTNVKSKADWIKSIRNHGRHPDSQYFDHIRFGINAKPTDLNACVGLGSVDSFWEIYKCRKDKWKYITDNLVKYADKAWISNEPEGLDVAPHGVAITFKEDGKIQGLQKALDEAGIEWKRNFGSMFTDHACFSYLNYTKGTFKVAENHGKNGLHIGSSQYWTDDDVIKIVEVISKYMETV